MADIFRLPGTKPAPAADAEPAAPLPPPPYAHLPTDTLVLQLVNTLLELKGRATQPGFKHVALTDPQNRICSMRYLVDLCQRCFTYIARGAEG